jgi:hypothetical protein
MDPAVDLFASLPQEIDVPNEIVADTLRSYDIPSRITDKVLLKYGVADNKINLSSLIVKAYDLKTTQDLVELEFDVVNPHLNPQLFKLVKNRTSLDEKRF